MIVPARETLVVMRLSAVACALLGLAACAEPPSNNAGAAHDALRAAPVATNESTPVERAAASVKAPRLVPLDGGVASIEQKFLGEHVVIARTERAPWDSWCAGPVATYDEIAAFFARVQERVAADDRRAVAMLVKFPLRVNAWRLREIASAEELMKHWDRVFSARAKRKIAHSEPAEVTCRDGTSAMFGAGVLWAEVSGGKLRLRAVND